MVKGMEKNKRKILLNSSLAFSIIKFQPKGQSRQTTIVVNKPFPLGTDKFNQIPLSYLMER